MTRIDDAQEEARSDMTPMIDCVFLLMIFFVLVIDLSQKDLEDLILPQARFCVPDDDVPRVRPVVNINQAGDVIYRGQPYYVASRDGDSFAGMDRLTAEWRSTLDLTLKPRKESHVVSTTNPLIPDDPVLFRGDKWAPWRSIGRMMQACAKPRAGFWRLELAMSEEDKEARILASRSTTGN